MIPQLSLTIIEDFREEVNGNNDFVRLCFANFKAKNSLEGKDIWSKICSCMDWITVAVEGIKLPLRTDNANQFSLEFTHFLVTIDMIVEAVNHLWLSIGLASNIKQPLINDRSVFNAYEFDREYTDEKYVKEIRSWFGIHAVNGNEVTLEGFNKGVRFFSSWSSPSFLDKNEASLLLYSNNSKAESEYGGRKSISIPSLVKFVQMRYKTLSVLTEEVEKLYMREKKRLQQKKVHLDTQLPLLKQVLHLKQLSIDRLLTAEHYESEIDTYIRFLKCDLNKFPHKEKSLVKNYLTELEEIIPAYLTIVQNVDHSEYDVFELLHRHSQVYNNHHYYLSKVFDYLNGAGNFSTYCWALNTLIDNEILPTCGLDIPEEHLYLLIHALDYEYSKDNSSTIDESKHYVEIIDDWKV